MTDDDLRELFAETGRQIRDLRASQAEAQAETDRILRAYARETQRALQDLAESQRRTDKQLGELGNRFGGYTEGLAVPSSREILRDHFKVDTVTVDASVRRNGHSIQIDVLGYTNGDDGRVYVVEIKSRLREEGLRQILKHLREFGEFFPEHRGKTLYGVLMAVDVPEELEKRVLKQGIYLAKIHGDLFELELPDGFTPQRFPC